jgi:superfamily II DNA or RNA helicase
MSIFDQLRKSRVSTFQGVGVIKENQRIYLKFQFDDQGAYLEVSDKEGNPTEFNYRGFNGHLRSILKNLQLAKERNNLTVDWENPEGRIYLHEHPYFLGQLRQFECLVNWEMKPVGFLEGLAKLNLKISKDLDSNLATQILLTNQNEVYEDFKFLNEEYAYLERINKIVEVNSVGTYFKGIGSFSLSKLPIEDLPKYLSLFYSYTENANLDYENYKIQWPTEPLKAKPTIIFEKVDSDNSLYIKIGQIMPNTELGFIDEYDLFSFVTINEIEETVTVHPFEQINIDKYADELERVLYKHVEKGKKKSSGIIREDMLFIVPSNIASEFIYRDIPNLINDYILVGSEKLKVYKINIHPPKLDMKLGHGIDFLEGSVSLDFGGQSVSLLDAINQFNKSRYIVLTDGTHALVNEQYMRKLQRLFRKKSEKGGEVKISFFDLPMVEEMIEERTAIEQFGIARGIFEGFNKLSKQKIQLPKIKADLRPYQIQGFKWLKYLYDQKLGGCLADDMGLGKTIQTITLLSEVYSDKKIKTPSLVVMPKSLLFNWEKELSRFAPHLNFYTWYATERDIKRARKSQVIITTYAMLRNDIEIWKEEQLLYVILDESQAIKSVVSQINKAVMLLDASHRLALSGTPVENNLSELYALFRFLNPTMFGSSESFNQHYLNPIQKGDDKEATKDLRRKIYPFILRRLKKDVLKELPDKIEQILYVEMNEAQAQYYEQRRLFYKDSIDQQVASKGIQQSQFYIFQALNELRQIASIPESQTENRIHSPKLELLVEQLEDAIANRHKVLVFANYLGAVELIGEELNNRGIDFVSMTGSTRNRQELVERFQTDANCKVFILTLKTGGTGLNLTAADMVFIFDPWWNKAAENQAIDRTHRIGQSKKVMSFKLITLGTIEEKILKLQEVKSALFENIISSDNASLKSISEEDIQFILGK